MHPDESVVHDLRKFRELLWLDRIWMVSGLLAAHFALGGWGGLVYGYCLSIVFIFQVTFAVNSIGHLFGPESFETGDGSRNNPGARNPRDGRRLAQQPSPRSKLRTAWFRLV